jgi:hypothetical protein
VAVATQGSAAVYDDVLFSAHISALMVYYANGAAGQPPAEAARAEQGRHHPGLSRVYDEHPGGRATLPECTTQITPATELPRPVG